MINELNRMEQENKFDEVKLVSYYSMILKLNTPQKNYCLMVLAGYISKLNAKKYYCLMVLIADDYFKIPIHTGIFNFLQTLFTSYSLQQKDKNITRFCSIVKKLNNDVLQKLANVMAKSSRTVIANVTDQDFLKLLNS